MRVLIKDRQNNLKEILEKEKNRLQSALRAELTEKLSAAESNRVDEILDSADLSIADLLESVEMERLDMWQRKLEGVVETERKLEEGTYGTCDECGEEISERRLAAQPFAIHCLRCAERLEMGDVRGKGPKY